MEEIILRAVVIQFGGRVVEVFGASGLSGRYHVALMNEPQIRAADRRGRSPVTVAGSAFGVDADELPVLIPFLGKISEAVRSANDQPPR